MIKKARFGDILDMKGGNATVQSSNMNHIGLKKKTKKRMLRQARMQLFFPGVSRELRVQF